MKQHYHLVPVALLVAALALTVAAERADATRPVTTESAPVHARVRYVFWWDSDRRRVPAGSVLQWNDDCGAMTLETPSTLARGEARRLYDYAHCARI